MEDWLKKHKGMSEGRRQFLRDLLEIIWETVRERLRAASRLLLPALLLGTWLQALGVPPEPSFHMRAYPVTALAGEPIAVDALGLPADATGSVDYLDNGRLVATVRLSPTRIGRYESFGDSITAGAGDTSAAHAYPALLGSALGLPVANHARNGSIACEMLSDGILPHGSGATHADLPLFSIMVGTNDADIFFRLPAHEAVYRTCYRAALAWLGVAREHKVLAGDPGAQPADDSWTLDAGTADAGLHTLFHRDGSSTARFTLSTAGPPAYLWYLQNDLLPGTFTLSIDGVPTGTVYQTQPSEYQPIVNHVAFAYDRLPLPAGTHVFEVQAVSGAVGIGGFGTPSVPGSGEVRPTVLVGDVPSQRVSTALLTDDDLRHYDYLIQTGLALLGQDGLDLRFVRTRDDMLGQTNEMTDGLHPNDLGEQELARAFERVFSTSGSSTSGSGTSGNAVTGSATLHLEAGEHQLQAVYSGDSQYPGFTSAPVPLSLGDASTQTTLEIGSTAAVFDTLSTLTASVTPAASPATAPLTGSVLFYDTGRKPLGSAPLSGGTASISLKLPLGAHTITAVFTSDLWRPGSTSNQVQLDVAPRDEPTRVDLSAQSLAGPFGTSAMLLATVTAPLALTPDGVMAFFDSGVAIGQATLGPDGMANLHTPDLPAGVHSFQAVYQGNPRFVSSSSAAANVAVRFAATHLTLTCAATHYSARQPVTVAMTVDPASATGTVVLYDGADIVANLPVVGGAATYTSSTLSVGTHALHATYGGDTYDAAAQSPTLTVAIDQVTTSLTLSGAPAQAAYGTAGTLLATLSAAAPTGTITVADSLNGQTTLLSASPIQQGQATFPLNLLAVGTHTLTATYSGDASDLPATASVSIAIAALPTRTALSASPSTIRLGETTMLTATVSPPDLKGQISLRDQAGTELARLSPVDGVAMWSSNAWTLGPHPLTANYLGDDTHQASTSPTAGLEVNRRQATVLLTALPASIPVGSVNLLTAQVTPADATGVVTFQLADGTVLGQGQLTHGTASATLPSLPVGSYRIAALYRGDDRDEPANSPPIATRIDLNPTSLTLSGLPATIPFSTPVTLVARLSASAATGTVSFVDSSAPSLGSTPLALGSAPLVAGLASLVVSDLAVGSHTVVATFAGDAVYAAASSAPLPSAVTPDTSTTELRLAQGNVPAGLPVTFNVRVQTIALEVPTGVVTIRSGTQVLAQGTLGSGSPGVAYVTLSISSAALGLGTFPVVAYYSGDATNTLSNSAASAQTFTVVATPVVAVLSLSATQMPSSAAVRASVSLTAQGGVPTGTVTFTAGARTLAPVAVDPTGQAVATLPALELGSYAVTALYTPSGLFAGSPIAPATLTVTNPLALAFNPGTLPVKPGSNYTAALIISPLSGFTGTIATTCGTSASYLHCTVDGPTAVAGAVTQATVHLSVDKDLAAVSESTLHGLPAMTALLLLPWLRRHRRTFRWRLAAVLLALGVVQLGLTGCATGGSLFSIPAGVQKVEVNITAGNVVHPCDLVVPVEP